MDGWYINQKKKNFFFALQCEVNNMTGLVPKPGKSGTNYLQGIDTSREPTLDDLRPQPGNPWITVASTGHHGYPIRSTPGGVNKEVQETETGQSTPSLIYCPKCDKIQKVQGCIGYTGVFPFDDLYSLVCKNI